MRAFSPSLSGVPIAGKIIYGAVIGLCAFIALYGLREGPLMLSAVALVVLVPFMIAAPFVLAGRWKAQSARPTRRPVVRKRRG